jgi:LPXTG-site transpeptidase (sortase) family protein
VKQRLLNLVGWLCIAGGAYFLFEGGAFLYYAWRPPVYHPQIRHGAGRNVRMRPARGSVICELDFPRLGRRLPVLEGDEPGILKRGPGHLEASVLPGDPGNSVIAAHRDTHFRFLKDIRIGDQIKVVRDGREEVYRVSKTLIVDPDDTRSLQPTNKNVLTLVTCYPFYFVGHAPERFVVRAQLTASPNATSNMVSKNFRDQRGSEVLRP